MQWLGGNGSGMLTADPIFLDLDFRATEPAAGPIQVRRDGASREAPTSRDDREPGQPAAAVGMPSGPEVKH